MMADWQRFVLVSVKVPAKRIIDRLLGLLQVFLVSKYRMSSIGLQNEEVK